MIKDIAHIGITVSNISEIIEELETLGMPCTSRASHDEIGMDIAFCGKGECSIELGEKKNNVKDSPISDTLGVHHIALKVEDIEKYYSMINSSDKYSVQIEIKQGAHGKVFFFRINNWDEILFECVE